MTKIKNKTDSKKYLNEPVSYDILGLRVTPKPLKLRWKLLTANISFRLREYCKKESGLTDEEFKDPAFGGFLKIYENSFFSINYVPENEPSGKDNLIEIITACVNEDINWEKFITDKMKKGKNEDEKVNIYNEIRTAGLNIYMDFFTEIAKIRSA